jgi:hypothetical protein
MIEIRGLNRKIASLFNVKEFNVKNTVFKFSFLENTEGGTTTLFKKYKYFEKILFSNITCSVCSNS